MDCMGLQGLDGIFVGFYKNFCGVRKKASPFRGGGSAERRDGEVAADLRRPLSQPSADSVPERGAKGVRTAGDTQN